MFFFLFYFLGSLFVCFFFFFAWHFFAVLFSISNFVKLLCLQPAKLYKLKHLSKVEVVANDPSGCTFTLVKFHDRRDLYVLVLDMFSVSGTEAICEASYRSLFWSFFFFFLYVFPSFCLFGWCILQGFDNLRSQSVAPPQWTMRNIDDR